MSRDPVIKWSPADDRQAPTTGRGAATREAVLEAAERVFERGGFARTTMHDIAAEAGFASGTVYQYFEDKADVLRCLLARLEDQLFRETRVPTDAAGRMVARDSVLRYLQVYRDHAAIYRAWWELLQPPTEFTDAWEALHASYRRAWVRALERGAEEGTVRATADPRIVADLVEATYERCAHSRVVMGWDEEVSDDEIADVMSRLLGSGLSADPPAE